MSQAPEGVRALREKAGDVTEVGDGDVLLQLGLRAGHF